MVYNMCSVSKSLDPPSSLPPPNVRCFLTEPPRSRRTARDTYCPASGARVHAAFPRGSSVRELSSRHSAPPPAPPRSSAPER